MTESECSLFTLFLLLLYPLLSTTLYSVEARTSPLSIYPEFTAAFFGLAAVGPFTKVRPERMARRIIFLCAASWCAASGFLLPGACSLLVHEGLRALLSRARKRSPNPTDDRASLEAVAAWPEESRLRRREQHDESRAVESRFYVLYGRAEELEARGEHRAASEAWKQSMRLWPAVKAIQGKREERFFACLPDDVVAYEKHQDALIRKLAYEAVALRQQGKVQAGDETMQRAYQLVEERKARERKHHERLGNHQGLLGMKDYEAHLPPGTTSHLENAYRAPPPIDGGLRKGWKNAIVSLPTASTAAAEDTATAAAAAAAAAAATATAAAPEVDIPPIALASRLLASASLRTLSCALLVIAHTAAADVTATAAAAEAAPEVDIPPIALASCLLASASLRTLSCALLVTAHTATAGPGGAGAGS